MNNKYLDRIRSTVSIIRYEFKCYLCILIGKIKVMAYFDRYKINKLEIGAGQSQKTEFITCDLSLRSHFPYDLRVGLPFPSDSIDLIYAEHVLEHFSHNDIVALLADCYRALRQGGVISISVPKTIIYIDAYKNNTELDLDMYAKYGFGLTFKSKIDYLNHIFYMDGQHRYMFDADNLLAILFSAGFKDACMRDFDHTMDQESRKHMSLFAIANK